MAAFIRAGKVRARNMQLQGAARRRDEWFAAMLSAPRLPSFRLRSHVSLRTVVRAAIVSAVASLAVASSIAALGVLWTPHASLGFGVSGLSVVAVAPGSSAARAGMRPGDGLTPSTPFGVRLRTLWYDAYRPGEIERVSFGRNGQYKVATLAAIAHRPPFNPLTELLVVLRVVAYGAFIVVGASLVLLRPARFTWGFFACCIGLATIPSFIGWSFTVIDPLLGLVAYGASLGASDVANVGFLAFALRFPADAATGWRLFVWRSLPLWLAGLLAVDAWSTIAWYRGLVFPDWAVWGSDTAGFLAWALGTVALVATYRLAQERNRRRLQWVIVGSSLGYLAWYLDRVLGDLGFGVAGRLIGIATLIMPVAVGYAVLKHRVIDVRFVLNRALTYSILASALVIAFAFSSWLTAALLLRGHVQVVVQIGFALIIGASLHRAHAALERALERALFGRLRNAEADLERAALAMSGATSRDALEGLLTDAAVVALDLEYAGAFRRLSRGDFIRTQTSGTSLHLADALGAHVPIVQMLAGNATPLAAGSAVALAVGDGPEAIVLYGPHRNGLALDPDEIAMLRRFTERAGPAYQALHARAGRVTKLAELLRAPALLGDLQFAATLAEHLLDEMSNEDYGLLAACAIVPDASADDVALVVGTSGTTPRLLELTATTSFVRRSHRGRYAVHPLLQPALVRRQAAVAEAAVRRCAELAAANGDGLRAAELYAAVGDRSRALGALAAASWRDDGVESAFASVLEPLLAAASADEVAAYPELLLAHARRTWPVENGASLRTAARRAIDLLAGGDADLRSRLAAWLAFACAESGDLTEAVELIERFDASGSSIVRAIIAGKQGRLVQCEALTRLCEEASRAVDDGLPAPAVVRATYVDRARGRFVAVDAQLGIARSRNPGSGASRAASADATFGAWLSGEERAIDDGSMPGPKTYPRFAAFTWLMRSTRAADRIEAQLSARLALDAATAAGEPFIAVIALVCLYEFGSRKEIEVLAQASALAVRIESAPLSDAIAGLSAGLGDYGMLQAVVRSARSCCPDEPTFAIEIATARLRCGMEIAALPEREIALLIALARSAGSHASATLIDVLWPGLDETSGTKALQTCVYRVRLRLGDARAIVSVAQGYQLGPHLVVDLWDAERVLAQRELASDEPFSRLRLEATARHFGVQRPASSIGWEWYDPLERRVATVAREARRLLAEHHLKAGQHRTALAYARDMIAADDLDEGAREIAMRSHLAAADVAEAWRELRLYREARKREHDEEVPSSLLSLLPSPNGDGVGLERGERAVSEARTAT